MYYTKLLFFKFISHIIGGKGAFIIMKRNKDWSQISFETYIIQDPVCQSAIWLYQLYLSRFWTSIWTPFPITPDLNSTMKGYQAQADLCSHLYGSYFCSGKNVGVIQHSEQSVPLLLSSFLSAAFPPQPLCYREGKKNNPTKWQRLNRGSGGTFLCSLNHEAKWWNLKISFPVYGWMLLWHLAFSFNAKFAPIILLRPFCNPYRSMMVKYPCRCDSFWLLILFLPFCPNCSVCTTSP